MVDQLRKPAKINKVEGSIIVIFSFNFGSVVLVY